MLEILDEKNFDSHIKDGLKLVMFGSDICQYCVKEQPVLEELAQNNINIGKIDAYKAPSLAQKFGITSFPTFILFKFGDIVTQFSGFRNKSELLDLVLKYI
ncbi:MAG: thioredoxin family protein [Candidatus Gastranaerophilales bacterium]|nr:thioredoxin family protein [Candidatus Gastranaerophilales bacterium]